MIQEVCDRCGAVLVDRNYVADRFLDSKLQIGKTYIGIEIILAIEGAWNKGELCNRCLIKVLRRVCRILQGKETPTNENNA